MSTGMQRRDFLQCRFAATTVLSVTYGHNIKSQDHPVVGLVQKMASIVVKEGTPEKAALLQTFPFGKIQLPFVPSTECCEYQNSQIFALLDPWPWLHKTSCNKQATGQGCVGATLRVHEGRSRA
jgi:hypothetical protein